MLVQSASVQIPNQGGCESEQNGWGQSFCSEMFSLHSCSGKGVDMWLLKKSWKVMHNWAHTTPNKDSNFPTYLKQMNQMVATRTFVGVTSKPRRPTWQKLKLQPSATSPRHCCKGIQICCCWGKKKLECCGISPEAILWSCFRCYIFQSDVRTTHGQEDPFLTNWASVVGKLPLQCSIVHYSHIDSNAVM